MHIIQNISGRSHKEAESITKDASKGALDLNLQKKILFMERW
ncbi:hypothetical protein J2W48_004155 [Flavobacterium piscis]|uniref:Uncharacterized protein n=1 Tax=Flavobacterium piscis TaxID=1114874 RepID=A0ABU1YD72_9FLAO|nr:hypothetical protein [Flavobacterium piscis]